MKERRKGRGKKRKGGKEGREGGLSSQDSSEKKHRLSKEALSIKANLHLVN